MKFAKLHFDAKILYGNRNFNVENNPDSIDIINIGSVTSNFEYCNHKQMH